MEYDPYNNKTPESSGIIEEKQTASGQNWESIALAVRVPEHSAIFELNHFMTQKYSRLMYFFKQKIR